MRICYVTCEGFYSDPIIQSQVDPLLNLLTADADGVSYAELITFEVDGNERCLPKFAGTPYVKRPFKRGSHIGNLLKIFIYLARRSRNFDVIHCRSYLPMLPVMVLAPFCRFKVVFDPRGLFANEVLYYKKASAIGRVFLFLESWLYRSADRVITVSNAFTQHINRLYGVGHRTDMISTFGQETTSGVKLRDVRVERGWSNKIILCYSGSLEGWQCIDDVIAFFKAAVAESPTFVVLFLSKSEQQFRARLADHFQETSFHVMSASPSELPSILTQCDYGVLFREDHIVNRVAAPIKLKDYLCAGIKVVVSPGIGDSEEMIRDFDLGFVVDKNVRASQLDALRAMAVVSKAEKDRIAKFANSFFGIARAVESYKKVYRRLLGVESAL